MNPHNYRNTVPWDKFNCKILIIAHSFLGHIFIYISDNTQGSPQKNLKRGGEGEIAVRGDVSKRI